MDPSTAEWHTVTMSLPTPFRWREMLRYLNRSTNECLHKVDGDSVWKCITVDSSPVVLRVLPPSGDGMEVQYWSPAEMDVRQEVVQFVREWLDLDRDLQVFYEMAARDGILKRLTQWYCGLRIVGVPDLFEALCWAISGQQVNLAFAYTLKRRLVESYGQSCTIGERRHWRFPTAEQLAGAAVTDLRQLQFTERKSEYILGVAELCATGKLTKGQLLACPTTEAASRQLQQVRGLGPWSAHYVLMRCVRRTDAFPAQDAGLFQAVQKALGMTRKPTTDELIALSQGWGEWKAYAAFYLWQSLLPDA